MVVTADCLLPAQVENDGERATGNRTKADDVEMRQAMSSRSWNRRVSTSIIISKATGMQVIFVLLMALALVEGINFHLPKTGKKCLKEEIHEGVLVTGEYAATDMTDDSIKLDLSVVDTKGHTLVHREDTTKGKFAFTTDSYDIFEVCFVSRVPASGSHLSSSDIEEREVNLVLKHGVEAKNYDAIAESAKLKPLEVELRRLEDLSDAIVKDFAYMRQREEEMRDTNESTNSRVLYFSVFSMCCLLGLATWQVLYLRRFFKAKKLIE